MALRIVAVDLQNEADSTAWLDLLDYCMDDPMGGGTGFSAYVAKPLLNIHDIVTRDAQRGRGIGQALLKWAEDRVRQLGSYKLTLEVLSNNHKVLTAYKRAGFAPHVLDPAVGYALMMQKFPQE